MKERQDVVRLVVVVARRAKVDGAREGEGREKEQTTVKAKKAMARRTEEHTQEKRITDRPQGE